MRLFLKEICKEKPWLIFTPYKYENTFKRRKRMKNINENIIVKPDEINTDECSCCYHV